MRNGPLVSKTDWRSEIKKSAERKRCIKTIANGSQLHRTGIEPMSIAWKATMLPLQQRCSHQELWLYNEKQSSCVKNWLTIGDKKSAETKRCIKTIANGSQLHRTGIEPMSIAWKATMLPLHQRCSHQELWLNKEKQYSFVKNWLKIGEQSAERERSTKTFTNGWQLHRTGIEPMSIAWKATMRPLQQRCSHQELWLYNEKQSSCVKNWLTIGDKKSAERKRCIKTIANGSQLHRTGIEPMSIAWKATMLPLHQRCSHETLWFYNEKQSSCVKNWLAIAEQKCREKTLH